ncbi:response regulator [Aquabacterium sp.]|uniref:response regulator n=1 Tax=Aquabacterium sp. TaxID=1872578 RepID=UPI00378363C0
MSSAPPSLMPVSFAQRRGRRLGLMLLPLLALPLLAWLTPQYEVANTLIAPLQPSLALALAATACVGWRALPAVIVGALLAMFSWPLVEPAGSQWVDALALVAQCAFGGLLMRRSGRSDDLALDSSPAIRRLVAVALACAGLGAVAELLDSALPSASVTRPAVAALVRATADGGSVMLLVPVVLALAAPQRERWAARWRSVVLPLAALALLLLAALAGIHERDRDQALARFDRDADVVFARTQALLDAPLQAVLALNGAMQASALPVSNAQFDALARPWLARTAGLAEIGWLDAPRGDGGAPVVRHLLPALAGAAGAAASPGDTLAGAAALRGALAKALAQDGPLLVPALSSDAAAASGTAPPSNRPALVIYQAVPAESGSGTRQVVFATVLIERLLNPLMAARTDALQACLFDADPRAERRHLYGPGSCEAAAPTHDNQFNREAGFELAGRRWALRISQPLRTQGGVWLFALPALAGGSLLAALLLALTGRVQRVETEARSRSLDMQRDIDQLRAQLQRQERSLDGVFDAVQTGVALIEADGRIQRVNAAFADLVGVSAAELRRRPIDDLLQDDDQPQPGRILALLQQAGDELLHSSLRLRLAGGKVMPALVTLRPLRERDGRLGAAVCALHDLSDNLRRRQAERVLGDVLDLTRSETAGAPAPTAGATVSRPMPLAAMATAAPAAALSPAGSGPLQRILCIHGSAEREAFLSVAFEERPLVRLSHAGNASDGLVLAETEAPHLVLLDLGLPGDDGLALLQQLSSDPRTRAIPVIVLSDDPRPDRIDAAFSAGARAYLTQPLDARQLLAAVDELI